jgi:YesN/AraC family two-component response regulator
MDEYRFYAGKIVSKLDAVRNSLLDCLEKKKEQEADLPVVDRQAIKDEVKTLNPKEEQQKQMKKAILAYLEIHYRDEDLSQTSVADAFQITNYTLSRMFKNYVGVGFTEYVNSKRLEYAKELLLTTSYSVREISVMVGFANDNYFSRIFKATVGMSPTAFREQ